ncbi:hypothetical protein GCM10009678_42140 [Actinomadura kijaniata]
MAAAARLSSPARVAGVVRMGLLGWSSGRRRVPRDAVDVGVRPVGRAAGRRVRTRARPQQVTVLW